MIEPSQCCGILVTHQPDDAVLTRITAHMGQLSSLVVVQTDVDTPDSALAKHCKKLDSVTCLTLSENNLGKAQNIGIRRAKAEGAQAVLLLDDDSEMGEGMLQSLCQGMEEGVGLIAPQVIERDTDKAARAVIPFAWCLFRLERVDRNQAVYDAFNVIASGSLIPLSVIEQVGLLEEDFGIDYLDREYCLRLLTRGYRIKQLRDARLTHAIGQPDQHYGITVRHHPPHRRFSIFRNRLRCWARYGLAMPGFILYDLLAACYDLFRISAFEEEKSAKLKAAFQGIMAAICGKDRF